MLTFGLLFRAAVLVAGIWWCKEIIWRFRDDVEELRQPDAARRGVIIGMWIVTVIVIALIINFAWGLIANIVHAF